VNLSVVEAALRRLTSEVLIFVLAYAALVGGMATLGGGTRPEYRLLYVLPLVGIAAHVWLSRQRIRKTLAGEGVRVRAVAAGREAYVAGVRGGTAPSGGAVDVTAGFAAGGARVIGVDARGDSDAADARYLMEIFAQLRDGDRRALIRTAGDLLDAQRRS
jgi:hypothetical protein